MIIIFTGNGKGKTTAAIGQAFRAVGNGSKVLMIQFIKGPWESGEHACAIKLSPQFKIIKKGKGFVGILNDTLPREAHVSAAMEAVTYAQKETKTKKWDIIILDEIWNAVSLGLITPETVSNLIFSIKPYVKHIIMTGRACPDKFIDEADLVTEMKEVKHPFKSGIKAKQGIEF